jgi:hypothetical protein
MQAIDECVGRVAEHFKSKLGSSLLEAYKIGSLAHGGFSPIYSDLDVGLILSCSSPPVEMDRMIAEAKGLDDEYGKKNLYLLGQSRMRLGASTGTGSAGSFGPWCAAVEQPQGGFSATHQKPDS